MFSCVFRFYSHGIIRRPPLIPSSQAAPVGMLVGVAVGAAVGASAAVAVAAQRRANIQKGKIFLTEVGFNPRSFGRRGAQ